MGKRVLIVGGVAGGASCAARLRRLDESAEIVVFDRGPYVSFANCGLPYFVGNVIADEKSLLVASSELFRDRFNIDVRTRHEVMAIDRGRQTIHVRDLDAAGGPHECDERYDALVLSPGAAADPPAPARHRSAGHLRRAHHSRHACRFAAGSSSATRPGALVVGGGFIGLEMAENLAHRGLAVTVLEKLPQVHAAARRGDGRTGARAPRRPRALRLQLGDGSPRFETAGGAIVAVTESGARLGADLVILAIGVRPETASRRRRRAAPRPARRHRRRRPDAHRRPAHLGGRRRDRGARRAHRPGDHRAAGRPRQPAGPGRGRVHLRSGARASAACRRPRWSASSA